VVNQDKEDCKMTEIKIPSRPIWVEPDTGIVRIIDQRKLPQKMEIVAIDTVDDVIHAIAELMVRGAPLIGVTGAYGLYVAAKKAGMHFPEDAYLVHEAQRIKAARPTAVNLEWAVDRALAVILAQKTGKDRIEAAMNEAAAIAEEEADNSRRIGRHGLELIRQLSKDKGGRPVNILTHCNAGWLACIALGTATAPVYAAQEAGIDVHVWVDETRPLNQGARLTAWELGMKNISHTVIADNTGGHLMQHAMVDIVIVGSDRSTLTGDVANKIGTYLKALAAHDNDVPFYVALPSSTFDRKIRDGVKDIPIERRDPDELRYMPGFEKTDDHLLVPKGSPAANYAFDVTPARLVTGFITERGICNATEGSIRRLLGEKS
jgi:methylthioribose-1-phosphate isomerase